MNCPKKFQNVVVSKVPLVLALATSEDETIGVSFCGHFLQKRLCQIFRKNTHFVWQHKMALLPLVGTTWNTHGTSMERLKITLTKQLLHDSFAFD